MGINAGKLILKSGDNVTVLQERASEPVEIQTVEEPAKPTPQVIKKDVFGKPIFSVKPPPKVDREEFKEKEISNIMINDRHGRDLTKVEQRYKKAIMTKQSAFLLDMMGLDE